jgi:hypothetical protein
MSIYHLHIPRTSGIYVKNFVVPYLITNGVPHFASNRSDIDPDVIAKSKFVTGHFGITPIELMDSPSVFTILRDPVEQFMSYFRYTTGIKMPEERVREKLNRWLYEEDIQHNMQSKFLTGSINIDKFNSMHREHNASVESNWFIENWSLEVKDIKDSLARMNAYTMENREAFKNDLNEKLKEELGFSTFTHNYKMNSNMNTGVEFTQSDINRIKEINSIDQEIYEYVKSIEKRY